MTSWAVKSQISKEAKRICRTLQLELENEIKQTGKVDADTVAGLAKVLADQLVKRREARVLVSEKTAKKQKRLKKREDKAIAVGEGAAKVGSKCEMGASGEVKLGKVAGKVDPAPERKGLAAMGPIEGIKAILTQFGPMNTKEMSQIYLKMTGEGFKKIVGISLNHVLSENISVFKKDSDKRWSVFKPSN